MGHEVRVVHGAKRSGRGWGWGRRERRLSDLLPGEQARVVGIGGGMNLRRRLADVGFIPGVPVEVVRVLAGGRLIEVAVRGTRFGLRWQEARQVRVE